MKITWRCEWAVVMVVALLLAGCTYEQVLEVNRSRSTYLIREHEVVKRVSVVEIVSVVHVPAVGEAAGRRQLLLRDGDGPIDKQTVLRLRHELPYSRKILGEVVMSLYSLVTWATPPDYRLSPRPVRWIIGNVPTIVGEGPAMQRPFSGWSGQLQDGVVQLDGTFRLVQNSDLDTVVTKLYILSDVPPGPVKRPEDLEATARAHVQRIELPEGKTLRDVLYGPSLLRHE